MLRPSSSVPNTDTFRLTARPLTPPHQDEYIAVPRYSSTTSQPHLFSTQRKRLPSLPPEAVPPSKPFDSRDRFVDDAVHINSVPRSKIKINSVTQFDNLHKLYHDLLLGFYYDDNSDEDKKEKNGQKEQNQQQWLRQRRYERRKNPKINYMLKRLLPLISQGLNELGHATTHRHESLEKVLPQSTKSKEFLQPPGGAVNWMARYLVRNNPTHTKSNCTQESLASQRLQRLHTSVLNQCLREYDTWQLCMEQREALEHVNLHSIWSSIDTNDDGTLDVSEVGKALEALGFQLRDRTKPGKESKNKINPETAEVTQLVVGDRVRARFAGKGHFYPADITAINNDGTYKLLYLDDDWENDAKKDNIQLIDSSKKKQNLIDEPEKSLELDLTEMQKLFSALDVDGSGNVDFDEFVIGTTSWFLGREALAKAIFDRNLDTYHETSTNDMAKLLQSLARKRMIRSLQAANLDSKKLFNEIDDDKDGFVDMDEFISGISKLAAAVYEESQQNQIVMVLSRNALKLFKEIDLDGDGLISLQEFQQYVVNFLDKNIEERANKAAQKIQDKQDEEIKILSDRGKKLLTECDRELAAEKVRLDKCRVEQLSKLRPTVMRFRIEVENDADAKESALLKGALQMLSDCVNNTNKAEQLVDRAASDLLVGHNILDVALSQPTSATRLADLKNAVRLFKNIHDPLPIDTAVISTNAAKAAVSNALLVVAKGMPLLDHLHQAHLTAQKKRKEERKKKEDARKLSLVMEAKRKREAKAATLERLRREKISKASAREDSERKEKKEREQAVLLKMTEAREEEERRVIRLEMRRASIAREEAKKAAIRATEEAEKAAAIQAQKRIDNWAPETSVFAGRGIGRDAGFFDEDKTCNQAIALDLEMALSKPALVTLINYSMDNQIEQVRKALLINFNGRLISRAILNVYRHYCISGYHCFSMQKFGFDNFVSESGILDANSKTCTAHHLETTFIASNMNTPGAKPSEKPDRSLDRAEFIEAIIRIGIQKFSCNEKSYSASASTGECVMRLILEHILPLTVRDSNELRINVLYTMQIDSILRKNDNIKKIKYIFEANCSHKYTDSKDGVRMNSTEWMRFVRKIAEGKNVNSRSNSDTKQVDKATNLLKFSEPIAKECFILSRLVMVDERGSHKKRSQQLSFEDFLESLVRLTEYMKSNEDDDLTAWDINNPDEVAPKLDELINSILSVHDRVHKV